MVRLSKQKQEKLENIMNLVEELGIDRVLARLRQTKMMSKEVLDEMKEWETDYEKRVALLGFLVSPEGKRAFGALYELAKVHEEQVRLQEEQEKLKKEQLANKNGGEARRGLNNSGSAANGGKQSQGGGSNMKNKLRAQINKRKSQGSQPNSVQSGSNATGKSKRANSKKVEEKEDPLLEEAARTLKEAQRQVQEKKRMDAMRSHLAAGEAFENNPQGGSLRSAGSQRSSATPTPKIETPLASNAETPRKEKVSPKSTEISYPHREEMKSRNKKHEATPKIDEKMEKSDPKVLPKALNDFTKQKAAEQNQTLNKSKEEESFVHNSSDKIASKSPPRETVQEHFLESNDKLEKVDSDMTFEVHESFPVPITVADDENKKICEKEGTQEEEKTQNSSVSELTGGLLLLFVGKISAQQLKHPLLNELVEEWKTLRTEREKTRQEITAYCNKIQQLDELIGAMEEEKEFIRTEKDKFVIKEFELQQKFQELTQKHKNLREDYESLKQGTYQIQQSNKKSNKLHQEMKKKIAKLESKIKSMDKVTIRRGTQTEDHLDKDVHEALRMAEESLLVTQNDLATSQAKLKVAQQEVDDYKKQVNIKGREINKRERKSKKDEDTIRVISRERDTMETKLKKMTEQMDYYKGMIETKGKGSSKKLSSEKKEIKVQRCASGRHVLIKTVSSSQLHNNSETGEDAGRSQSRSSRSGTSKQSSRSKQSTSDKVSNSNKKATTSNTNSSSEKVSKPTISTSESVKTNQTVSSTTDKSHSVATTKAVSKSANASKQHQGTQDSKSHKIEQNQTSKNPKK